MKTLRAFWHWVDNDKPARITREHLSEVAITALYMAEAQVMSRAGLPWYELWTQCSSSDGTDPNSRPEFFRPELVAAVRDLSLAICPALEAMHAAVPETKPEPKPMDFRREYLGEWIPAALSQDTFFGVDYGRRRDEPLSGVRVPQSFGRTFERQPQCPCRSCAAARRDAAYQAAYLGVDAEAVQVATHDGLMPLKPGPEPSAQQRDEYQRMSNEVQQRNDYERTRDYLASVVPPGTVALPDPTPSARSLLSFSPEFPGGTLTLTLAWLRLARWDTLRGLTVGRVVLEGPFGKWMASALWHEFSGQYLAPLLCDGATLVTE